jgi:SAM-dependent methyltransferase
MRVDLANLARRTQAVYERNAERFDAERPKSLHERIWLDRFTQGMEPGASVLDLGCGAGRPIAAHFMAQGFRVTGLDASRAMLALARSRLSEGDWRLGDMRKLDLEESFDGIIGWNSFFHLTKAEQRCVLPRLARHLRPGGALMLTVGPRESEASGHVGDDPVYHASLAPEEYHSILADHGLAVTRFVLEDPECDCQSVLLAHKHEASLP